MVLETKPTAEDIEPEVSRPSRFISKPTRQLLHENLLAQFAQDFADVLFLGRPNRLARKYVSCKDVSKKWARRSDQIPENTRIAKMREVIGLLPTTLGLERETHSAAQGPVAAALVPAIFSIEGKPEPSRQVPVDGAAESILGDVAAGDVVAVGW
jgi:hypothetical protein